MILHQLLTRNQTFIFFLIPILIGFSHISLKQSKMNSNILIPLLILLCLFTTAKYHFRFNEERKFNELENVDIRKSVNAGLIHSSLNGLRWITADYPEMPKKEIKAIKDSMFILQNDKRN